MRNTRRLQATSYAPVTRCYVLLGDTKGKAVGTKRSLSSSCGSDRRRLGIIILSNADLHIKSKTTLYTLYFQCIIKRRWRMIGAKGCFRTWEVRGRKRCVRRAREKRETEEIIRTRERATVDLHVFLPVPAYIISICNLVKHSYLNN